MKKLPRKKAYNISSFFMSRGILCKMLVLGINEMVLFAFPLKF
jgi:hypothetical protein